MKMIVDRIEETHIIVETDIGKTVDIPKELIPNVQEGDVIKIEVDKKETNKRKKIVKELINSVFEEEE